MNFALYDGSDTLIDWFDTREDAMLFAVTEGISTPFKIYPV